MIDALRRVAIAAGALEAAHLEVSRAAQQLIDAQAKRLQQLIDAQAKRLQRVVLVRLECRDSRIDLDTCWTPTRPQAPTYTPNHAKPNKRGKFKRR